MKKTSSTIPALVALKPNLAFISYPARDCTRYEVISLLHAVSMVLWDMVNLKGRDAPAVSRLRKQGDGVRKIYSNAPRRRKSASKRKRDVQLARPSRGASKK